MGAIGRRLEHCVGRAAVAVLVAGLMAAPARAQEPPTGAVDASAAVPSEPAAEPAPLPLYTEAELDELVAPVALFPDALLAQVFVASTYPLDVVKADRFLVETADLSDAERAAAAEMEGWDPSVAVLAGGFPSVVGRMAAEIEWTEELGNALLVQTDDVLDATQRMRARAQAVGNLESNAAQTVTVADDAISIAPADPEVVYVPTYEPAAVYTTPPPAAPAATTTTVESDAGFSTGAVVTTGLLSFGAGILVNEVFSDDDDWDDYWRRPAFDWDDDALYPRPGRGGITAGGDVTINVDSPQRLDRAGAWQPDAARRDQARRSREVRRDGRPARTREAAGGARSEQAELQSKLAARSDGRAALSQRGGTGERRAAAPSRAKAGKASAFERGGEGLAAARKDRARGEASAARRTGGGGKSAVAKREGGGKLAKATTTQKPKRAAIKKSSAFERPKGGGGRAKVASARGKHSAARRGGGKRRR